jgi:hypothetical protein
MTVLGSGCSEEGSEPDIIEAPAYADGTIVLTDGGVFAVELWNDDGQAIVGDNTFVLRVCLSHTDQGVPGAEIGFDGFMPDEDSRVETAPTIEYVGDGQYELANVELDRPGTWQFDVDVTTDSGVQETVSFAFQLAG